MNDRELLELASKAAGIAHAICYDAHPEDGFPTAYAKTSKRTYWNPLTDDGDALRLAVKLGISINLYHCSSPTVQLIVAQRGLDYSADESVGHDVFAATRRAIVRAAAEIGRAMP